MTRRKVGKLAIDIECDLLEELRDTAAFLQRHGMADDPTTLSATVRQFLREGIDKACKKHRRKSMPKRNRPLPVGRRVGK